MVLRIVTDDEFLEQQSPKALDIECCILAHNETAIIDSIAVTSGRKSEGEMVVACLRTALASGCIKFRAVRSDTGTPYLLMLNPRAPFLDVSVLAIPIPDYRFREFKLFAKGRERYRNRRLNILESGRSWGTQQFTLAIECPG